MKRAALVALAALILAGGCAERDRSNPLDPLNQKTGGQLSANALAGDRQVEIRWTRLTQTGVLGYQLMRWLPGGTPAYFGDFLGSNLAGEVDSTVTNGSTYIYKLVAQLASGDSVVSPPDTATPGTRKIAVLAAGIPGLVGLTPDGRDVLFSLEAVDAIEDMELDVIHDALWLTLPAEGAVLRDHFDGTAAGPPIAVTAPSDVSVSNLRGVGWVAVPALGEVQGYGPDLNNLSPRIIPYLGEPHVVEAGTVNPGVWIGNEGGTVYRYSVDGTARIGEWNLGSRVVAIALEDAGPAWVATRASVSDAFHDKLYRIDPADSSVTLVRSGLLNTADLAFDNLTQTLWVSERGAPDHGAGRLTRITRTGDTLVQVLSIEPFGISIESTTGDCWVSDLRSNRVFEISGTGAFLRWSPPINIPYGIRAWNP